MKALQLKEEDNENDEILEESKSKILFTYITVSLKLVLILKSSNQHTMIIFYASPIIFNNIFNKFVKL